MASMHPHELPRRLSRAAPSKTLLVVIDGLGGLPLTPDGLTELGSAATPHLYAAASEGVGGMSIPVLPGLAADCATAHLALFGYNPLEYTLGRGTSEALGLDFPL